MVVKKKVGSTVGGGDSQMNKKPLNKGHTSLHGHPPVTHKLDSAIRMTSVQGFEGHSDAEGESHSSDGGSRSSMQIKILRELQKVNIRLDYVEDQVVGQKKRRGSRERDTASCKSKSQSVIETTDLSDDVPVLQT